MLTDNSSKTKIKTYSFSEQMHLKYLTLLKLKYEVIYYFLQCEHFVPVRSISKYRLLPRKISELETILLVIYNSTL